MGDNNVINFPTLEEREIRLLRRHSPAVGYLFNLVDKESSNILIDSLMLKKALLAAIKKFPYLPTIDLKNAERLMKHNDAPDLLADREDELFSRNYPENYVPVMCALADNLQGSSLQTWTKGKYYFALMALCLRLEAVLKKSN